jgi:hypothetical protein
MAQSGRRKKTQSERPYYAAIFSLFAPSFGGRIASQGARFAILWPARRQRRDCSTHRTAVVIDKCGSILGEAFKANDVTSILGDP